MSESHGPRVPTRRQLLAGGAAALVVPVGAGIAAAARDASSSAAAATKIVAPTRAMLPFAATSPWRLAIGTAATFAADSDPRNAALGAVGRAGSVWVNYQEYSHPIAMSTGRDPKATVTDIVHSTTSIPRGGSWTIHIPGTARIAQGSDAHMHVVDPSGRTVYEHWRTDRLGVTAYDVELRHAVSLSGSGIGPQNGARGYGGSAIGGLIRAWEVDPSHPSYTGRIGHPLAIALRVDQLHDSKVLLPDDGHGLYTAAGYGRNQSYVWPATQAEVVGGTVTGPIDTGQYVAIPPDVDIAKIGLTSGSASMLARALQDYGAYVVDASGAACFYIEDDGGEATARFHSDLIGAEQDAADIARLFTALRIVTNNSPSTPNGAALRQPRRA